MVMPRREPPVEVRGACCPRCDGPLLLLATRGVWCPEPACRGTTPTPEIRRAFAGNTNTRRFQ